MRKILARSASLAAIVLLAVAPAHAETKKIEEAGIQFDLPEGWKAGPDSEDSKALRVENADESIAFVITVASADSLEAVAEGVGKEVDGYLKDVKVNGDGKEGEHNGMKTWSVSGTGVDKAEGDTWEWDITIFMAKKPVVVLTWVSPEDAKSPPADAIAFSQSFKKL